MSWPRFKVTRRSGVDGFALALGDGALHHAAIEIESHRGDLAVLFAAEQDSRRRATRDRERQCGIRRRDR